MIAYVLFAFAVLMLVLIPLAPNVLRIRIRVLKWLHWDWAVNLLENHFDGWVLFLRIVFFGIAVGMLYAGWANLHG